MANTPERRPLRIFGGGYSPSRSHWDGHQVIRPGEDGYDAALAQARRFHDLYGVDIPYAQEDGEPPR